MAKAIDEVIELIKKRSTIIGFLLAPLFGAFVWDVLNALFIEGKLGWTPVFYFFMVSVAFFVGLTTYLLLDHFGMVRWWTATLTGLIIGAVVYINGKFHVFYLFCIPVGGLAGLVLRLIWRQGYVNCNSHIIT